MSDKSGVKRYITAQLPEEVVHKFDKIARMKWNRSRKSHAIVVLTEYIEKHEVKESNG